MLAEARRTAGLTQAELADALGKPQSFVSKFERGERRLDLIEFLEITELLSVSPNAIVSELKQVRDARGGAR